MHYRLEVKPMHIHEAARRMQSEILENQDADKMPVLGFSFIQSLADMDEFHSIIPHTFPLFDDYLEVFLPILNDLLNEFPGIPVTDEKKSEQMKLEDFIK